MRTQKYHPNYTVADYRIWKGDWELIDGVPSAMTPSPSPQHQIFAKALVVQIDNAIVGNKGKCDDCEVVYELDWVIDNYTVLRPDIAIICNFQNQDVITTAPSLIVEIVSPSSALKDRHTKFEIYQEQQVPYYIIVDPKLETFSTFVLVEGYYEEQSDVETFRLGNCSIAIDIRKAFARVHK
jgi:Uma2 family endonuclease